MGRRQTESITAAFIQRDVTGQSYEISLHADNERIADGLTMSKLEYALLSCKVLERYPDDPRGESCLVLGFTPENTPIHVVCGRNRLGHLVLITVYIPRMPKWKNPYMRCP